MKVDRLYKFMVFMVWFCYFFFNYRESGICNCKFCIYIGMVNK